MKLTKAERSELEDLSKAFGDAREALLTRLQEIQTDWQNTFLNKSEKWCESDVGTAAQERIDRLTEMVDALDNTEEPDIATLDE